MDASDITPPLGGDEPRTPNGGLTKAGGLLGFFRDDAEESLTAIEILNILRRRKHIVIASIVIITAIAAAIVLQITPRYTAESALVLDTRKTEVVDLQAVLSGLPTDTAVVNSEVEVLQSPSIAQQVAAKLNLVSIPEFNPRLRPPSALAPLSDAASAVLSFVKPLVGIAPPKVTPPADQAQADLLTATQILQSETNISNDGKSYIIRIRVQSQEPKLAAALANAYADTYLQAQLEEKFDAVRRANDWLNGHLTELRKQVEAADQAVQAFKAQHNITDVSDGPSATTVTTQQLAELNSQLIIATADRAQKESNLQQIEAQIKTGGVDAAAQVLASPLIQQLQKQEADLRQQEAELATKYKPAYPAMINIRAQIRNLRDKIADETNKIVHAMAGEVAAARAREAALRQGMQQLEKSSAAQNATAVQLHELQRQADSTRLLYENFLNRFKQTSAQEDIQQADAHIVARASVPTAPSYPRKGLLIGFSFIASILVGACGAFGVERLDHFFRTAHQLEKLAQVTALGLVPAVKTQEAPQDLVISNPMSPYSEAIRTIRTALRYSDIDNPPKIVLVTSALPQEGKSLTALSLARSVAHSGGKSLLIDCDLRRPSISKLLRPEGGKAGLLSLFEPAPDIAAAIDVDRFSGMHFISSAGGTSNPQDLLGSKHFRSVIERLRAQYDMIVLDTPPVLAVSDAMILSHIADATMFLVRWGSTPRAVTLGALKSFRANGGRLAGAVLTRVDFRQHATYGYGDSGYFYGRYGNYYGGYEKRSGGK